MIYAGIDIAESKHSCCILNPASEVCSSFDFTNDNTGFEKFMSEIIRFSSEKDLSDTKQGLNPPVITAQT